MRFLLLQVLIASILEAKRSTSEPRIVLPSFFADNMVLSSQRSNLWGKALCNSPMMISLSVDGSYKLNQQVVNGEWLFHLPKMEGTNRTIQLDLLPVTSDTSTPESLHRVILSNVAFGEVYFCSGQSNMEMSVSAAFDSEIEIEDSVNYPDLRMFTVSLQQSNEPQWNVQSKGSTTLSWRVSAPDAFSNDGFGYPSAVCYFTGRERYKATQSPIGLVMSSWGGQPIEAFSSETAMQQCRGELEEPPSSIWNGMIYPFRNMQFDGVLWYQGESNSKDPENYACRFPAMIADWRDQFNQTWPFYYVQLAGYSYEDYSLIRAAQNVTTLPDVYPTIALDLGDPTSPYGPIHPRRKQEVGRRLALQLSRTTASGPVLNRVHISEGGAELFFQNSDYLHLSGTAGCSECCYQPPFTMLDAITGNWTRPRGHPEFRNGSNGTSVIVSFPKSVAAVGVRLEWEGFPQCALYNGVGGPDDHSGLPAAPFEWCMYSSGKAHWTGEACALSDDVDASLW